jgi:amidohydrolase family protein
MWAPIVPAPEVMRHISEHFPREMAGYLRVFFKQEPEPEEFRKIAAAFGMSEEDVIARLDEAGIARTLITGFDEWSSVHETFIPNELVAELAEHHPDRFIPFFGADVLKGMDAVRELETWVTDRGFRGLSLRPFMIGLPADDRRYYPLYAKCVELGVPLSIHSSANWTTVSVTQTSTWSSRLTARATCRCRAPAGSRCCDSGRRRFARRSSSALAGSCLAVRRGRFSTSSGRFRSSRTCSSCGCTGTPSGCSPYESWRRRRSGSAVQNQLKRSVAIVPATIVAVVL